MKKNIIRGLVLCFVFLFCLGSAIFCVTPSQILIYRGDTPDSGPGLSMLKLTVGEEATITVKGLDENGATVDIWPTFKCDKELAIKVVEGKSKVVVVKGLKTSSLAYVTAIYLTDDGKRITGDLACQVTPKK